MTTVEKIKSKILDLAIRGKLVPQDPNDEPASVLLERIKAEKAELVNAKKIKKDKNPSEIIIGSDGVPYEKFADGTSKDLSDEISFDIPDSWQWVRLGKIGDWKAGATPSRNSEDYYKDGDTPWLKTGDLNDGVIYSVPECITAEAVLKTSVRLNPIGSVLIAMYGATIGKVGILGIAATTNQACCACIPNEGIYNKYLFYFLMSQRNHFKSMGGGGAQPNISKDIIISTLFPLPPLAEQKRIVAKVEELFAYADQIGSASEEITKTAQRLDKKILDLAIRGKLVQQNPNDEPTSELVKRIEAARNEKTGSKKSRAAASHKPTYEIEPPFDIPDSWEWVMLGDVVQFMSGNTPSKDALVSEGIPYFKVAEMNLPGNECVLKHTSLYVSKGATIKKIPKGTIVFPKNGGAMLTNKKRILGQESVCDLNTGGLKSYIEDMTDYLFLWFVSIDLGKYVKGGVIPTTNVDKLRTTPIPLPPLAEQERIVKKIDELKEMTQALVAL